MPGLWEAAIDQAVEASRAELIALRRYLHQYPEVSGAEFETTQHLVAWLRDRGFEPDVPSQQRGLWVDYQPFSRDAEQGVAAGEPGQRPPRRIGLRADIDALPIQDVKPVEYCSRQPDVMHACGHDAHTTIVTGALLALKSVAERDLLPQPLALRALYQPAEETCEGAREMIAAGAIDDLHGLFATHVDPSRPTGCIGWRAGELTANCDELLIRVRGRGGHGARPHQTDDPVTAAATLIVNLQTHVARSIDSHEPVVVSIGSLHGGHSSNVIPGEVVFQGTLRTLTHDTRENALEKIRRVAAGVSEITGCRVEMDIGISGPAVINDPTLSQILCHAGGSALGPERVVEIERPSMGSEDFAFYSERIPVAMFRLGCRSTETGHHPLHTPAFDIDEEAMLHGSRILARAVVLWSAPELWQAV